jgi:hypothetical protein
MQSLEVSGAVRPIYGSLGVKRLRISGPTASLLHTPSWQWTRKSYLVLDVFFLLPPLHISFFVIPTTIRSPSNISCEGQLSLKNVASLNNWMLKAHEREMLWSKKFNLAKALPVCYSASNSSEYILQLINNSSIPRMTAHRYARKLICIWKEGLTSQTVCFSSGNTVYPVCPVTDSRVNTSNSPPKVVVFIPHSTV